MEIMEFLRSRTSIRKYRQVPVPEHLVGLLLEAGQRAPSRANSQPWKFVVIPDPQIKQQLYTAFYR